MRQDARNPPLADSVCVSQSAIRDEATDGIAEPRPSESIKSWAMAMAKSQQIIFPTPSFGEFSFSFQGGTCHTCCRFYPAGTRDGLSTHCHVAVDQHPGSGLHPFDQTRKNRRMHPPSDLYGNY